ncbi:acyl-CoA dehydrogenase family protein [Paenibacillus methanolicus]|uniref:Alkylation response protein AidB-like acyl-CoA dehydrogenase n=1 Tax=Paenibacillus methanolicus TaxID=582686 RepID=A0A5S5BYF8_9BACL|nr:acyl-CoA dehydrogenase family protein [Paenibacillus methanolicus]TYP70683.1 alkylation response protein AidB-like acyl-CoA dehydrogenase [Paenibacillus methanolicus]
MANNGTNRWGGRFVVDDMPPELTTTPEDLTEEQLAYGKTAAAFAAAEASRTPDPAAFDAAATKASLRAAGDLGLLGADVPEVFGGLGLDWASSTLLAEKLAAAGSLGLTMNAHAGIGTLPIVLFGTAEQKARYLPDLAAGKRIAAYALTEPGAGSDALRMKTTARLSPDGTHYVLRGAKQFVSNAGAADVFVVFAKVDGDYITAFIVERGMDGFEIGPEERKMGINGTSTCSLHFDDTPVPADNVLGEAGYGHAIAFNVLNIGRFKLAAHCVGGAKEALAAAVRHAGKRKQFGRTLTAFPLVGAKLADMNIAAYAAESMAYRTAGRLEDALRGMRAEHAEADGNWEAVSAMLEEYAIECSANKIFATEALDRIVDEALQIHGGYGYMQGSAAEQMYRDARVHRIVEGTNEINRLLIPTALMRKALRGELPLLRKARALQHKLHQPMPLPAFTEPLAKETYRIGQAKTAFLAVGGLAVQKYGLGLEQQQEVMCALADMMIQIYAMESACLRARKRLLSAEGASGSQLAAEMTAVFVQEAMDRIDAEAKRVLATLESGDALQSQLGILRKLMRAPLSDTIGLKRGIAAAVIRTGGYIS